jgi:hypothetical protein
MFIYENEINLSKRELRKRFDKEIQENGQPYLETVLTQVEEIIDEVKNVRIGDITFESYHDDFLTHAAFKLECYIETLESSEDEQDIEIASDLEEVVAYLRKLVDAYRDMLQTIDDLENDNIEGMIKTLKSHNVAV